jgi:hypothetical protein
VISVYWPPLHDRLVRLAETFHQLKERVRDAVATEMGKVVADTVREWITTALQGRVPTRFRPPETEDASPRYSNGWDDDDHWAEEEPHYEAPAHDAPPEPKVSSWAAALSLGFIAAKWLIARRLPFAPSVGAGVLLGAFALVGGPLVQASLAAASAAGDLITITRSDQRPAL